MSESLNLCLSCELCCDGTTIGYVELDREELPLMRTLKKIEEENGNGFFLQPCDKLGCNGCTIYDQRPKQCAAYECKLLKSVEQKELDFNSAMEVINAVKQVKVAIEKWLEILPFDLKSQSFYFKTLELKNLLRKKEAESPLSQNLQELKSDLQKLDQLMAQKFGLYIEEI